MRPDHANVRGAIDVVLREDGALIDDPAFDVEVLGRNAPVRRVPVLVAVDHLDGIIDVRRDALDQRDLILDGDRIGTVTASSCRACPCARR